MKAFTLSIGFLFALNSSSFALNPPTSTQLQALQSQLTSVQALQSNIVSLTQSIARESGRIDPNHTQIAAWEQQLQNQKARLPPLCQKLMDETRIAYGIRPNRYSGKIVLPGGFKDTYADYRPKFGPMEQTRVKTNRAGRSIAMGQPDSYDAIVWENGDIIVTIAAFNFSPGYLAAVMTHETIHFDQFTTPGRGDKSSSSAREREAYNTMIGLTNRPIFQLSPEELKLIDKQFDDAIRNAPLSKNGTMVGASGFFSVDLTQNPNGEELLLQAMSEAKELAAKQRERIEQERQRDHDERLKTEWINLAHRSCDAPGSVSQNELDALPRLHKREPLDVMLLFGNCYERVYYRLYNSGTAEEIRQESTPSRAAVPPAPVPPAAGVVAGNTFESVLPKLKDFAEIACTYQGKISPIRSLFTPRAPYLYSSGDESAAANLMAGLTGCQRHLFRRLFDVIRSGNGGQISEKWLVETVASTPVAPVIVAPPQGGGYVSPPPAGTNPCERNGDPFGCQKPHP